MATQTPEDHDPNLTGRTESVGDAVEALNLMLGGETEAGLASYRRLLGSNQPMNSAIAMHPHFLRQAGKMEAARRLTQLAIEFGVDIAVKANVLNAPPADAATEYEALFAEGIANSAMIARYLELLAGLGRFAELHRILDLEHRLGILRLDSPAPEAVEQLLLELEPGAELQHAEQSVRRMRMVKRFAKLDHPVARTLVDAFVRDSKDYLDDWRSSGHPLAHLLPKRFEIDAWGLVSRGEGFNTRHIHHQGWVSGVYYPTTITPGLGGELHIGRPDGAAGSDDVWSGTRIRPEAGMLVLMPSYYTHWTVPLQRPGLRTSIAFDVLPLFESMSGNPFG